MHGHVPAGHVTPADPFSSVTDAVYRIDRRWRFTYVNAAAARLLGRRADDMIGRYAFECFPETLGTVIEDEYRAVLLDGRVREFDYFYPPLDRWFEIRAFADAGGLTAVLRDVDDQRRTEQRRLAELRQLGAVLEALPPATVLLAGDGRIEMTNRAWTANGEALERSGGRPARVGEHYLDAMARYVDAEHHAEIAAGLRRLADGLVPGSTFAVDYPHQVGPEPAWFRLQAARVDASDRVIVTHTDITERVRDQQALAWQANHDDLTGLPNRTRLLQLIREALEPGHGPAALLFLDLDGFKTVNDSLGHDVGDELLRQVGGRLAEQVRPGDAVGRLGADQFLVLARNCDIAEAASLAFRLQSSFSRPFHAEGISVPLSVSIGVAAAQPGADRPHQLLSDADTAAFAAKGAGRDRVHVFSPGLREAARWRLEVANRLRDGAVDEFVVHYQPVVRVDTGEVEGVEALLRWQHPERGLLAPDAFLSVAEETGQLIPITRWLLGETTRQAAEWAAQGLPLRMSVNISARHFSAETLVRDVRVALHDSGLAPENLVLELTETSVAEDPTRAEDQLSILQTSGVSVAIDDFGTGWSSLAQLLALPVGTLKIDRSLLTAAARLACNGTGPVLAAIVSLARTLGIRSVAEGVETAEHLQMVREAGCDLAQGYLLARPMPASEVLRWASRVRAAGGDSCALALQASRR
ncbi:putative bifunctional diguanylate cyclase/phosphodiesterase [Geodermatophilus poikilotrophus]|uniref:PAS domain S-box-containing protein/diguanylate cyclase (GGDEF) domain-containing protein n=1 Tax=Geodermatophilus poikilotrophus TaxID=1333667 RepID=A0A1I0GRU7_9ACTN|nr:EAL domain-containing protein [Geodermatophilus poikilotrophus]SET72929.1 PAS domain S-box-containing protein/diguanylate cyclase (GGDEF) domain-containing protein [Geodermatophilus poikilotrophus]